MKKSRPTRRHIKYLFCVIAAVIGLSQPWAALAVEEEEDMTQNAVQEDMQESADEDNDVENTADVDEVKYIAEFETFAEEDAYFPCMYKPALEELLSVFPETVRVWLEGEEDSVELEVTWECEEDFDNTQVEIYVFYPKWDEALYAIADAAADSVEIPSITVEVPVESGIISDLEGAKSALKDISQKSILALVYLCDEYEVKKNPSYDSETVQTVHSGQSVQITDVELDEYGSVWYRVLFYQNATEYAGYVEREYLATANEDFADWEDTYLNLSAIPMVMAFSMGYPDVDQFPASYQNALYALKEKHPNWTFVKMNTGLDWNTVIANELGIKSLISSKTSGSWQNGVYGQGWSYASEGILKYYMDPRNFLNDPAIFQFEQLTYNESYHTTSSVQEVIKNSFMQSAIPGDSRTYAQAFTQIGQEQNVSPFHLAARVLQEQGAQGTSPLISGTYAGYEGYYNYFNVEASGKTNLEVIVNGLKRAVASGWNTRFKSLDGGAAVIGGNYITKGQDTIYLEKFNVSNGKYANFTHQYMQNIQAPASEAANVRKAYNNAGALENSFVFNIPVYNNMPAYACSKPETVDSVTLNKTTGSLEVNKTMTLVPYVNGSKVDYISDMTFTSSNTSVAIVNSQGKVTAVSPGTATISCTRSGADTATCTVTVIKANPSVQTPVLSPYEYRDGLQLSDIILPAGWEWEKGNVQIKVGTFSYPAVYTPTDTIKYNVIKKEISFTVTKALPVCKTPEGLEAKTGTLLGDIILPSGFAWESDTETELKEAGEYTFYVSYNPNVNNYFTVENLAVMVVVTGKSAEPSTSDQGGGIMPGGSTSGGSGTPTSGNTSSSSSTSTGGNTSSGNSTTTSGNIASGASTSTDGNTSSSSTLTGGNASSGDSMITGGNTSSSSSTSTGGNMPSSSTSTGGNASGNSTATDGNASVSSTTTGGNTSKGSSTSVTAAASSTGASNNTSTINLTGNNSTASDQSQVNNNLPVNHTGSSNTPGSSMPTGGNTPDNSTTNNDALASSGGIVTDQSNTIVIASNVRESAIPAGDINQSNAAGGNVSGESARSSQSGDSQTAALKPSVTMQMEDTTILTAEKLQMAKEQNFNLVLDMGNSARWSIEMDSVDLSIVSDADMGITFGTENIPTNLIAELLDGNKYLEFTLSHSGEFGFDPVLEVALDPVNSGRYANLFYYNSEAEIMEYICSSVIDENGVASFKMEHASSYVIIVSDSPISSVPVLDESDHHRAWWIVGSVICLILAAAGSVFFYYKKRKLADGEIDDEELEDDEEPEDDEELEEDEELEDDEESEEDEELGDGEESDDGYEEDEESDWIEDKDWHEPEMPKEKLTNRLVDDPVEDEWIEDDEWERENEWVDDEEWERMNAGG
ncbi:MAG: Ig-like domain-containing protein [Eubacterium sp.]|nr:Ig-like domain-containing protein [Eubacterium sp.]